VAVVGAGPCGLTTARDLAQLGYAITVFEAQPLPGGMLRYGIPDYRLPPAAQDRDIDRIRDLGVEIRTSTPVTDLDALQREYGAVLLSVGAHHAAGLRVPGEELPGVYSAIDFLRRVNSGERPDLGRRAVVVGGGNTAIDAARCARRLGVEVTLSIRPSGQMPAYAFEEAEEAAEGVEIAFLTNPTGCWRGPRGRRELGAHALGDRRRRVRRPLPVACSEYVLAPTRSSPPSAKPPTAPSCPRRAPDPGGAIACATTWLRSAPAGSPPATPPPGPAAPSRPWPWATAPPSRSTATSPARRWSCCRASSPNGW
jgi:NADPH-dependent glutamate synthase beta subunit-like oxidoreductase